MYALKSHPTSIRIFLTDGTPEGLRILEVPNWTGRAAVAINSNRYWAFSLSVNSFSQTSTYT